MTDGKWKVHGRCDGPIPELKLKEFVKWSNHTPKARPASSARSSTKGKSKKKVLAEVDAAAGTSTPAAAKKKGSSARAKGSKAGPSKGAAPKSANKRKRKDAEDEASSKKKGGTSRNRSSQQGNASSFSKKRKVAAKAVALSAWASAEVKLLLKEFSTQPIPLQKGFLKQKLLLFHPDKRSHLPDAYRDRTEAELTEVFVDIKRRYDLAVVAEQQYEKLLSKQGQAAAAAEVA